MGFVISSARNQPVLAEALAAFARMRSTFITILYQEQPSYGAGEQIFIANARVALKNKLFALTVNVIVFHFIPSH
jgi:hypothetical protein